MDSFPKTLMGVTFSPAGNIAVASPVGMIVFTDLSLLELLEAGWQTQTHLRSRTGLSRFSDMNQKTFFF